LIMAGPSNLVREAREAASRRRLEIAKILREDPATTNIQLAKMLNVSRNTITSDRASIMENLTKETLTTTEALREQMAARLERLDEELERHRKNGKLPVNVIHEAHLLTRSLIELLGCRKPIVEKVQVERRSITFRTTVKDGQKEQTNRFTVIDSPTGRELITEPQRVLEGDHD
jgi:DNA repair exonuclease SbcCD nuclease subunit